MKKVILNLFYLFFPLIIGGVIGLLISNNMDYSILTKPPLAPPKWLFPVAWTIIYLLMGLSFFLFKRKHNNNYLSVDLIYYIQLFVNAMWSIIFFIWKWRLFSCIWIILLLCLIIKLIIKFITYSKISAWLNVPYLLWVIFATYLTIGIYILN